MLNPDQIIIPAPCYTYPNLTLNKRNLIKLQDFELISKIREGKFAEITKANRMTKKKGCVEEIKTYRISYSEQKKISKRSIPVNEDNTKPILTVCEGNTGKY